MIQTERVYEAKGTRDGKRFLVDRLWPRGMKKEAVKMDGWLKEVAPSDALRHWFDHDPAKWKEFQRRYRAELSDKPENWEPLLDAARDGDVTLLFSAHDMEHNNAVVLKTLLEERLGKKSRAGSKKVRTKGDH